ncbi:signal transduction histidine kinase [Phakopsora pachyrhizi]|nr:signal transduction histidine kinase [Phakopsora pachyrhizi]
METFGQLLEMDDDEEHSFSKSLTYDYFDQAVTTFSEMDVAVSNGDLITLSRKGHFLKGSSAALGLNQVKASCEKMQHYGNKKKSNGEGTLTEAEAMEKCKALLEKLKNEQKHSKAWLEVKTLSSLFVLFDYSFFF